VNWSGGLIGQEIDLLENASIGKTGRGKEEEGGERNS
jgi:hypothetical protein